MVDAQQHPAEQTPPAPAEEVPAGEVELSLRRLLAGDARAAAWLYDTFAPRLYRRLRGRYGHLPGIDPGDLLQDAFLFYLQNDGKVLADFLRRRSSGEITADALMRRLWDLACGVASNRRRTIRGRPPLTDLGEEPAAAEPAVERRLAGRQILRRLAACLERRGERLRLYFTWRYADGLTPREIADAAGWSRRETYRLKEALDRALTACAEQIGIDLR